MRSLKVFLAAVFGARAPEGDAGSCHPYDPGTLAAVAAFKAVLETYGAGLAADWLESFAQAIRQGEDIGEAAASADWDWDL